MDWIKDVLPDDSQTLWLVIICIALVLLNVYQFAKAHAGAAKVKLLLEHGHAPEGKAIVSSEISLNPSSYGPSIDGRPEVVRIWADGKVIVPAVDVARAQSHVPPRPLPPKARPLPPLPDVEGAVIQPRGHVPAWKYPPGHDSAQSIPPHVIPPLPWEKS